MCYVSIEYFLIRNNRSCLKCCRNSSFPQFQFGFICKFYWVSLYHHHVSYLSEKYRFNVCSALKEYSLSIFCCAEAFLEERLKCYIMTSLLYDFFLYEYIFVSSEASLINIVIFIRPSRPVVSFWFCQCFSMKPFIFKTLFCLLFWKNNITENLYLLIKRVFQ